MATRFLVITTPRIVGGALPKTLEPVPAQADSRRNKGFIRVSGVDIGNDDDIEHFGFLGRFYPPRSGVAFIIATYERSGRRGELTSACSIPTGAIALFILATQVPDAVLLMERAIFDEFNGICRDLPGGVRVHHCDIELARWYPDEAA